MNISLCATIIIKIYLIFKDIIEIRHYTNDFDGINIASNISVIEPVMRSRWYRTNLIPSEFLNTSTHSGLLFLKIIVYKNSRSMWRPIKFEINILFYF